MVKNYGIHDKWKDLDKVNDIDIKSIDGVIDSIKVNGEEAGGGLPPVIAVSFNNSNNNSNYTFTIPWLNLMDGSLQNKIVIDAHDSITLEVPFFTQYVVGSGSTSKIYTLKGDVTQPSAGVFNITGACTIKVS